MSWPLDFIRYLYIFFQVATNMIAEGKLWEGVELLCLSDKVFDACIYLQSCQNWDSSLWLAKCRLGNSAQHRDSLSKGSIDLVLTGRYVMGCLHQGEIKHRSLTWYTAHSLCPPFAKVGLYSTIQLVWNLFIYRYNKIGMFSETMWLSTKITEMLASKLIPKADVFLEARKVDRECCCFLNYLHARASLL